MAHDRQKNQPIKTNQELPEMLELSKGSKTVIITIFRMLRSRDMKNIFLKDSNQTSRYENYSARDDKHTGLMLVGLMLVWTLQMKILVNWKTQQVENILKTSEDKLKTFWIETIQNETQRKRLKKNEQMSVSRGTLSSRLINVYLESFEERIEGMFGKIFKN